MAGLALGLAVLLSGCFELSEDATFREDGSVRFEMEIGLSRDLLAQLANPPGPKRPPGETPPDPFLGCGKPTAGAKLPEGIRSMESRRGTRGDMETCRYIIEAADPVAQLEQAKNIPIPNLRKQLEDEISLSHLPGKTGYRLRMGFRSFGPGKVPPRMAKEMAEQTAKMLAGRYLKVRIVGKRVENSNGEVAADRRSVTWRFPMARVVDLTADKPVTIEADIIYR